MQQQTNHAALYCRLSRDDGSDAESNSITTQREILTRYANEHDFVIQDEYIDDGISGTTFERPAFQRMIKDIESGIINIVLCKDLSRLGRNNALVAYYTEIFFVDHNIRFIAVNDSIDSAMGDNEIMPFKSVINEYYARDISKKVRSAKRARALNGEHSAGRAPYGYLKNPQDKRKLVIDDETAPVVRTIFQMYADGQSAHAIRKHLLEQRVPTPSALEFQRSGKIVGCFDHDQPWNWSWRSVHTVLCNQIYLGHMVSHRATTKSFKHHTVIHLPEEEWIIVKNTHEAIVSEELFEKTKRILSIKERPNKKTGSNLFAGLLQCADCGRPMTYSSAKKMRGGEGGFNCNGYRHGYRIKGERCTPHNTPYRPLRLAVLAQINQALAETFRKDDFLGWAAHGNIDTNETNNKKLAKFRQRDSQLRVLIRRVFEQNANGSITDETFAHLYNDYQAEQKEIASKVKALETKLNEQQGTDAQLTCFLQKAHNYMKPKELTRELLLDFVEKIEVFEGQGPRGERQQDIKIHYRFIAQSCTPSPLARTLE